MKCFSQECFRLETTLKDLSQPVTGSILIADDQPANRELLEELLTREGFNVLTAGDGADALETVKSFRPDLVLLDVMMPKLSGFQVCEQIKADRETGLTPVILITALSNKEDRVAGIQAGADDFLTRPADRSELLARVRSLLKLKARTDELERAESVLFALARSIEGKDPYTQDHCDRLSQYAARLGECLGLPEEQLTALRRAAIVHDVGKVAVPDAILLKPGKLTDEELECDEGASCRRRTHLFSAEGVSVSVAYNPPPSRKAGWLRISRWAKGRCYTPRGSDIADC
jgi:putative two-component system response regulator